MMYVYLMHSVLSVCTDQCGCVDIHDEPIVDDCDNVPDDEGVCGVLVSEQRPQTA